MSHPIQLYLQAQTTLNDKLDNLLPSGESEQVKAELDNLRASWSDDDDFVNEMMDFLQGQYPAVYQELQTIVNHLGQNEVLVMNHERIQPLPGKPVNIKPGMLLVCPICGYEHELRNIGEWPVHCPTDGKKLEPKAEE